MDDRDHDYAELAARRMAGLEPNQETAPKTTYGQTADEREIFEDGAEYAPESDYDSPTVDPGDDKDYPEDMPGDGDGYAESVPDDGDEWAVGEPGHGYDPAEQPTDRYQDATNEEQFHNYDQAPDIPAAEATVTKPRRARRRAASTIFPEFSEGPDRFYFVASQFNPGIGHALLLDEERANPKGWKSIARYTIPIDVNGILDALEPGRYRASIRTHQGQYVVGNQYFTIGVNNNMGFYHNPAAPPPQQPQQQQDSGELRTISTLLAEQMEFMKTMEQRLSRLESDRAQSVQGNPTADRQYDFLMAMMERQTESQRIQAQMHQDNLKQMHELEMNFERRLRDQTQGIMRAEGISDPLDAVKNVFEIIGTISGKVEAGDIPKTDLTEKIGRVYEMFQPIFDGLVDKFIFKGAGVLGGGPAQLPAGWGKDEFDPRAYLTDDEEDEVESFDVELPEPPTGPPAAEESPAPKPKASKKAA